MDPVTATIIGGGALLGGLSGGLFNMFGAQSANEANKKIAREQMKFQERMSNTAYSRAVEDMQNAGLNPAAMFASGAGTAASTPAGTTATMENELEGLGNNIANAPGQAATAVNEMANAAKTVAETNFVPEEKKNQIANTAADTLQKQAQTENIQANTELAKANTTNTITDTVRKELENEYIKKFGHTPDANIQQAIVGSISQKIGKIKDLKNLSIETVKSGFKNLKDAKTKEKWLELLKN